MQKGKQIARAPRGVVARALCLLALIVGCPCAAAVRQSLDMQVPWRPVPVKVVDKTQFVYELHLTNFAAQDLELTRLSVVDAASGATLADFRGDELAALIGRFDRTSGKVDKRTIPPGVHAVVYLTVPLRGTGPTPPELTHKVEYIVGSPAQEAGTVEGGRFTASNQSFAALGPPLRGGPWVAIYDSSWERGHRRVLYAISGKVHVPGRFAIDWIKVDASGKYFNGDGSKVADWHGYGAEVLAVADSVVAAVRDDVAENDVVPPTPPKVALEDASGNYVALDLGGKRYAFYEHLKPGSIKVKRGNHVKRGQVIALLGFTGESTGPHLHFHVSDNNSPLDADGLPYTLAAFKLLGSYSTAESFAHAEPWTPLPVGKNADRRGEMPGSFSVIGFQPDSSVR